MQRHEEPFHRQLAEGGATGPEPAADEDSIPTIHGKLRLKRSLSAGDLAIDHHSRLGGTIWRAPLGADWTSPLDLEHEARPLDGIWSPEISPDGVTLRLEDEGARITKSFRFDPQDGSLEFRISVESAAQQPWLLLTEWNFLLGHTGEDLRRADGQDGDAARGQLESVGEFRWVAGGECGLELSATPNAMVAWDVIRTVHSSEAGLERTAQGTCWMVGWKVEAESLQASLRLRPTLPPVAEGDPL
jgi:hypothetical protein